MADEIVWEEPPPATKRTRARGVWEERLAPLRERPGEWANFGEHWTSAAAAIRKGHYDGVVAGEFEATLRNCVPVGKGNKGTLYVRYVGKPNLKAAQ